MTQIRVAGDTISGPDGLVREGVLATSGANGLLAWVRRDDKTLVYRVQVAVTSATPRPPAPPPPPVSLAPAAATTTQYQSDAAHTGRLAGAGLGTSFTPAWSFATPHINVHTVTDGTRVYGVGMGTVVALDAATGTQSWSAPFSGGRVYLALAGDRLIAQSGSALAALNVTDGTALWSKQVEVSSQMPPVIDGDRIVLSGRGSTGVYRVSDGSLIWRFTSGEATGAAIGGGQVMVIGSCGWADGLSREDAGWLWHRDNACSGGSSDVPAFDGGWLWTGDMGFVIDPSRGAVVHAFDGTTPSLDASLAVNVEGDHTIVARDLRALAVRWSHTGPANYPTAPLLADGRVYTATVTGQVEVLDLKTGALLSTTTLPSRISFDDHPRGLAAASGLLIVTTDDGVTALRTTAGAQPTPTATATPQPTATATASPSPTATATATATPSPTATATPQPTATATPSPTPTASPEPTSTATPEPTPSPGEPTSVHDSPRAGGTLTAAAPLAKAGSAPVKRVSLSTLRKQVSAAVEHHRTKAAKRAVAQLRAQVVAYRAHGANEQRTRRTLLRRLDRWLR